MSGNAAPQIKFDVYVVLGPLSQTSSSGDSTVVRSDQWSSDDNAVFCRLVFNKWLRKDAVSLVAKTIDLQNFVLGSRPYFGAMVINFQRGNRCTVLPWFLFVAFSWLMHRDVYIKMIFVRTVLLKLG